jgi:hypothetical protein
VKLTATKVQIAVDRRTVDKELLLRVAAGRFVCSIITRLLRYTKRRLALPLNIRIKQHYSAHIFHAMARLDVPTFDDAAVQRQLEQSFPSNAHSSIAWDTVVLTLRTISTALQLVSQVSVLVAVLQDQRDGPLIAVLGFAHAGFQWVTMRKAFIGVGGEYRCCQ